MKKEKKSTITTEKPAINKKSQLSVEKNLLSIKKVSYLLKNPAMRRRQSAIS
jgi:hypothetical protein